MKKYLKFFNAVLFLAAFGVSYMELVHLAIVNVSLMDLIKLGFGKTEGPAFAREIMDMIQDNITPFAICAVILVFLMWGSAILSVVLRGNLPYICGTLLALIQAAGVSWIYFGIRSMLDQVHDALSFFGMGSTVRMYSNTLIIWLLSYGLVILFSVIGLLLKGTQSLQNQGPIMPEQFYSGRNPLGMQNPVKAGSLSSHKTAAQAIPEKRRFTGAVVGLTAEYASKAFPLSEKQQVFFVQEQGKLRLLEAEGKTTLASVYYIEEYQEYCVEPYEIKSFFLKSGQPLGKGRSYYLPRGTEIYIKTKENRFRLA